MSMVARHIQNSYKKNLALYIKWTNHHDQIEFIPGMRDCLTLEKSIDAIFFLKRIKGKNYRVISTEAG